MASERPSFLDFVFEETKYNSGIRASQSPFSEIFHDGPAYLGVNQNAVEKARYERTRLEKERAGAASPTVNDGSSRSASPMPACDRDSESKSEENERPDADIVIDMLNINRRKDFFRGIIERVKDGDDINQRCPDDTYQGGSALHMAASFGDFETCFLLVALGANLAQKDAQGKTPAELVYEQRDDLIEFMRDRTQAAIMARNARIMTFVSPDLSPEKGVNCPLSRSFFANKNQFDKNLVKEIFKNLDGDCIERTVDPAKVLAACSVEKAVGKGKDGKCTVM